MNKKTSGFSLVELLIVIAIIAILTTVAVPMYSKYITENNRSEAVTALLAAASAQDKNELENGSFVDDITTIYPANTENGLYVLSGGTIASGSGYEIIATAQGSQASDTDCATITLRVRGGVVSKTPAECWS